MALVTKKERERIQAKMAAMLPGIYDEINNGRLLDPTEYQALVDVTRNDRMAWWRDARFGIFIHYGIYSARGYGEWELAWDAAIPAEYEASVADFKYQSGAAESWVLAAKAAGAKYIILTTRHHDGFSLWDSKTNPFNAVNYGPKIDIVKEYTEACRKHGMKIGFYSTIMDWRHPDCAKAMTDVAARARFLEYTYQLNRELLTNYGKIDILWYDMPYPELGAIGWDAYNMNQKLRALQPHIIINNRSGLPEDIATPEENFTASENDWETCLTFNQFSWGYLDEAQEEIYQYTPQGIAKMLSFCARNKGNLLLNVGPDTYGRFPESAVRKLAKVGDWLKENGAAVYGERRACQGLVGGTAYGLYGGNMISWVTAADKTVYVWEPIWPKTGTVTIAGYDAAPKRVYLLATGENIDFTYSNHRIVLSNLPKESPDKHLGIAVLALEFEEIPNYRFCGAYPHINDGNTAYPIPTL